MNGDADASLVLTELVRRDALELAAMLLLDVVEHQSAVGLHDAFDELAVLEVPKEPGMALVSIQLRLNSGFRGV